MLIVGTQQIIPTTVLLKSTFGVQRMGGGAREGCQTPAEGRGDWGRKIYFSIVGLLQKKIYMGIFPVGDPYLG
jgi:hypothetical protein